MREILDSGVSAGEMGAALSVIYSGGSGGEAYAAMVARARPDFDPRVLLPSGTMVAR